jgi:hypothetical protein
MLKNQLYILARAIPWEIAKKTKSQAKQLFLKKF